MPRAFLALVAALLNACAEVQRVPDSWGPIQKERNAVGCPSINGTYANIGENPDGTKINLALWLDEAAGWTRDEPRASRYKFGQDLFHAKLVSVMLSEIPTLDVQISGDGISRTFALSKNRFECKGGVLSIKKPADASGDNVAMIQRGTLDLYRSTGYLLANNQGTMAALLLVVPIAGYGSFWARFPVEKAR